MEQLQVGKAKLTWLKGGVSFLDGGAMFGVVPRPLWTRHYPHDENFRIELRSDPILLQLDGKNFLIDSGLGNNKLTEKQKHNFGVLEESFVEEQLKTLGLGVQDIDAILMTHMHYDHAGGLTKEVEEEFISVFPKVPIYTSAVEWDEMRNPNIRSINTYWKMNWEPIQDQVQTFDDELIVTENLRMIHTSGHSDGHSIIIYEDGDDCFIHMADLMATHGHQHKLWVMAYDDYPIASVHAKEKWMAYGYERKAWYTFYHDAYYRALRYNSSGEAIDQLERMRYDYTE